MHVLLIDDDRLSAEALGRLIEGERAGWEVQPCASAQRALVILDGEDRFDLVLVNDSVGALDGLTLLEAITARARCTRVALMSAREDERLARAAADRGAAALLSRTLPTAMFLARLDDVAAGRCPTPIGAGAIGSGRRHLNLSSGHPKRLSRRGREVLELVVKGHSNKRIALLLGITEATVKYHVHRLLEALGVTNRTSCVREAHRLGLIEMGTDAYPGRTLRPQEPTPIRHAGAVARER